MSLAVSDAVFGTMGVSQCPSVVLCVVMSVPSHLTVASGAGLGSAGSRLASLGVGGSLDRLTGISVWGSLESGSGVWSGESGLWTSPPEECASSYLYPFS